MFVLAELSDTIKVDPHRFRDELKALRASINAKYGDRILPGTGLCIALHSITSVGDAFIFPGSEGAAHFRVTFKMVVFKPFKGEIITGKVRTSTVDGLYVSLGFFEDVFIPAADLQAPSTFVHKEGLWMWSYETEGTEEGVHPLWYETGDLIRLRVSAVQFNPPARQKRFKKKPNPDALPPEGNNNKDINPTKEPTPEEEVEEREAARMVILGQASEDGLGMVSWWMAPNEGDQLEES